MVRKAITASALLILSATAVYAQGETTATQPEIRLENNDNASERIPTLGTAREAAIFDNVDGKEGATRSTTTFDTGTPEITQTNNDNESKRVPAN